MDLITTHISWLLLTPERVWKIKRPVRFDFLDYGDRTARDRCCREELRLNRRLAEDVYLGLGAVVRDGDRHRLVPEAEAPDGAATIELAVLMRRLDEDAVAEGLLERDELTLDDLDDLARRLVTMHAAAECEAPAVEQMIAGITANADGMAEAAGDHVDPEQIEAVTAWLRDRLATQRPLLAQRRERGRVRECHGDLRLEHVYRTSHGIRVIDAIDFDPALRRIDVADEVAFLAADCRRCRRADLGEWFAARYALRAGDYDGYRLLDAFQVHRLLVMAKVAGLKLADRELPEADHRHHARRLERCLACAAALTGPRRRPRLILLTGLIASGKSSVADALARDHGAVPIVADRRRKQLAGLAPEESGDATLYTEEWNERTYAALRDDAAAVLASGRDAVCDASFRRRAWRRAAVASAREADADVLVLHLRCDRRELRRRLRARSQAADDPSDADESLLERFEAEYETPTDDEGAVRATLDTDQPHRTWQARLAAILADTTTDTPTGATPS